MATKFRSDVSAFDVIHGRPCACGEQRAHVWPFFSRIGNAVTVHRENSCDRRESGVLPTVVVPLTPEMAQRAEKIAAVEGKTVEKVVHDAMTIAWVRHAAKYGW